MRVSEIFETIQGEGPLTGTPSIFIRLQGCTVGCSWCDTKYTWDAKGGEEASIHRIFERIMKFVGITHVVVTGGEPLEAPDFVELVGLLSKHKEVQIESAAVKPRPVVDAVFVLSPKLPGVTRKWKETWKHLPSYDWNRDYVKIVCADHVECVEALDFAAQFGVPMSRLWLMPCGMTEGLLKKSSAEVWKFCTDNAVRFSGRQHVWVHGPKRRV